MKSTEFDRKETLALENLRILGQFPDAFHMRAARYVRAKLSDEAQQVLELYCGPMAPRTIGITIEKPRKEVIAILKSAARQIYKDRASR